MPIVASCPENWEAVRSALSSGHLAVVPTDTVYGLVCDPYNITAIERIYEVKGRPTNKALPLLISGPEVLRLVAREVSQSALALVDAFWPGALTLVVARAPSLPLELTGGGTVAVRMPDRDDLRLFLDTCGGFVAGTSANLSGQPDACTAGEAYAYFGDAVAVVLDGGPSRAGAPSTLVDCTANPPRILRRGAIGDQAVLTVVRQSGAGA